MPQAKRTATAEWQGDLFTGSGTITETGSGALSQLPVSWKARTAEQGSNTSPEELIAAAHASCYAMAFSNVLASHDHPAQKLTVSATTVFDMGAGGAKISNIDLNVSGVVPGVSADEFKSYAEEAEKGCPVSNALRGNVEININASLAQ